MKRYLLLLSLLIIGLSSCEKVDVVAEQIAADDAKIQAYIKANNLPAKKDEASGVYYYIFQPGDLTATPPTPSLASTVQVTYVGKFLNGETFDQGNVVNLKLSNTIKGWQVVMPKIGKGGRVMIIVPSTKGYGSADNGSIPGNSVLVFSVDLIGFY